MTPYYEDESVTIYHGDCEELLPAIKDIDLVLTSPPYNLGQTSHNGSEWRRLANGYASHDDSMPYEDYVAWQQRVLTLAWNTLSDTGAVYYQHKPRVKDRGVILPFELNPGLPLRQIVTWNRGSGFMRQFTCYVPSYEWILIFAKERFRITTRDIFDVWNITPERGVAHPAPFPLRLALKAIGSTAAETVLDPFMGSGTTLRAAKDLGRKAIGIEIEEKYCEIAARRMCQEVLAI